MVAYMNLDQRFIIGNLRELLLILTVDGISKGGREAMIEPQRSLLTDSLDRAIKDLVENYNK